MQTTANLHAFFRSHLLTIGYTLGLAVASYLIWADSVDRQPAPLGAGLRWAAVGMIVAWSHLLLRLFRKMLRQEISAAYCSILFFGAWAVFFLAYNCLR